MHLSLRPRGYRPRAEGTVFAVLLTGAALAAGCTKREELARSPFITPLPEGQRPANAAPAESSTAEPADQEHSLASDSAVQATLKELRGPDGKPKLRPASGNAKESEAIALERARAAGDPKSAAAQIGLARAYHREKIYDLALRHYERARELAPRDPEIGLDIGQLWVDAGTPGLALPYLDEATRRRPEDAQAWSYRGIALDMLSRYPEAEESLRRAVLLDPRRWDYANNLGYNLLLQERYADAAAEFARGLRLAPGEPALLNNLGLAVGFQGLPDSAFTVFHQAGSEAMAWNNLGVVQRFHGDTQSAATAFEKAARLDPGSREIAANLLETRRRLADERALDAMSTPPASHPAGEGPPPDSAASRELSGTGPAPGDRQSPETRETQPAHVGSRLESAPAGTADPSIAPAPERPR